MKVSLSYKIFTGVNMLLLSLLAVITLYPLLYVIFASLSHGNAFVQHTGLLLAPVGGINFDSYREVFKNASIFKGYGNTILLLLIGVPYRVILTAFAAYVLSRKDVYWKNIIMFIIVFTMFFEGGMIPFYLLVKNLHLRDSLFALIIPFSVSVYNMIIMRTSFAAIPTSLEESAKLDGASHWSILFKIILPLSKPVIAVMCLYYGVEIWNGWFWASLFISDKGLYPLQLILREILIQNDAASLGGGALANMDNTGIAETIKYATIVVSTLPILFVYPFIQKYFAKGVMIGAVKG